jgi:hypothetical protein
MHTGSRTVQATALELPSATAQRWRAPLAALLLSSGHWEPLKGSAQ